MASGRKKAMDDLREYAERHQIVIQDRSGRAIAIEEFLEEGLRTEGGSSRTAFFVVMLILGLVVLGARVLFLFLR
jgi:hypothetical protein